MECSGNNVCPSTFTFWNGNYLFIIIYLFMYVFICLFIYLFHYGKIEITHLKVTVKFESLKILEYTKISFKKSMKETYTYFTVHVFILVKYHVDFNFLYLLLFL